MNSGVTSENLKACVIFSDDISEGVALPASMMCGVNDGPFSLTDEDWIPHSAAWLTGLARLGMESP